MFSITSFFLPRENLLAGVQKAQLGFSLEQNKTPQATPSVTCLARAFHIRRGALKRFFGEAKRNFYYWLSVIRNDNRKEGDSGWQIGRKVGICEREGDCFLLFFLLLFYSFYCRFICRDLETELRPSAVDISLLQVRYLPPQSFDCTATLPFTSRAWPVSACRFIEGLALMLQGCSIRARTTCMRAAQLCATITPTQTQLARISASPVV